MRGHGVSCIFALYFFISITASFANANIQEMVWKDAGNGLMDSDLRVVAASPDSPETVHVSSVKVIYKTEDGGESWNEVLSFRGTDNAINTIAVFLKESKTVYAGTMKGLYRSNDMGLKWKRIFKGMGKLENAVFSIAVNPHDSRTVHIGTLAGIFTTDDNGNNWTKGYNLPARMIVTSITLDPSRPNMIYAAAGRGMYKSSNSGAGWKRIYESGMLEERLEQLIDDEETDMMEIRNQAFIRDIAVDPAGSQSVYAGTSKGLLISDDAGLTWRAASSLGLISRDIKYITINAAETDNVYAATDRGVFK